MWRRCIGSAGGSGRNFCNVAQLAKTDIGELAERFGEEALRFVVRHQARMFADFQLLVEAEGIDCELAVADLLHLAPGTAVRWAHQAGADWNRYATDLARTRAHQHGE